MLARPKAPVNTRRFVLAVERCTVPEPNARTPPDQTERTAAPLPAVRFTMDPFEVREEVNAMAARPGLVEPTYVRRQGRTSGQYRDVDETEPRVLPDVMAKHKALHARNLELEIQLAAERRQNKALKTSLCGAALGYASLADKTGMIPDNLAELVAVLNGQIPHLKAIGKD